MVEAERERTGRGGTVPPIGRRWKPGQSGNPKGRPPDLLREATLQRIGVGRLAEIIAERLQAGDGRILVAVLDRLWPKPPSAVEVSGPDGAPIDVSAGAREKLIERLKRRDGAGLDVTETA